jgi:hypothetical protein
MLFKRRTPLPFSGKLRNIFWPKMGLKRIVDYYKHRSIRIPDSEHSIASGLAFGCLVSWTPTFGTHIIQCALFCWLTRTNFLASVIGSAFGNFWTTPFLIIVAYKAGKALLQIFGFESFVLDYDGPITSDILLEHKMQIFLPTLIGGYAVGIVTFPLFYYPFYYMVKGARAARRLRLKRKAKAEVAELTSGPSGDAI